MKNTYTHTHTHIHTHTYTYTYTHTYTHIHTRTHTNTHTHRAKKDSGSEKCVRTVREGTGEANDLLYEQQRDNSGHATSYEILCHDIHSVYSSLSNTVLRIHFK